MVDLVRVGDEVRGGVCVTTHDVHCREDGTRYARLARAGLADGQDGERPGARGSMMGGRGKMREFSGQDLGLEDVERGFGREAVDGEGRGGHRDDVPLLGGRFCLSTRPERDARKMRGCFLYA